MCVAGALLCSALLHLTSVSSSGSGRACTNATSDVSRLIISPASTALNDCGQAGQAGRQAVTRMHVCMCVGVPATV